MIKMPSQQARVLEADGTMRSDWAEFLAELRREASPEVGEFRRFGGAVEKVGWLLADGRYLERSEYQDLYLAIGDEWGPPTSSQFALPNLMEEGVYWYIRALP